MADENMKFEEILAIVKYKIANKIPMTTAREEFVDDIIMDAIDLFGYDFVYGEQ